MTAYRVNHRKVKSMLEGVGSVSDLLDLAARNWGNTNPSTDELIAGYVSQFYEKRTPVWYEAWHRLCVLVVDRTARKAA